MTGQFNVLPYINIYVSIFWSCIGLACLGASKVMARVICKINIFSYNPICCANLLSVLLFLNCQIPENCAYDVPIFCCTKTYFLAM